MLEIRIHGRGGQGAQVACQLLAAAFFRGGDEVQAFAAYGGERRGAPVTAFLRVDSRPIRLRCDIERAGALIVLDRTLLAELAPGALRPGGLLVVNAAAAVTPPFPARVVTIDAGAIAEAAGLAGIVSTAMLGAFAGASGLLPLDVLAAAVAEGSPARAVENAAACRAAYYAAAALPVIEAEPVREGASRG